MTDDTPPGGTLYTRPGHESRIVGTERETTALAEALNDADLHVAWADVEAPLLVTRRHMKPLGYDYPVFVLPTAMRAAWEADPDAPGAPIHDGPLPTPNRPDGIARFDLVRGNE